MMLNNKHLESVLADVQLKRPGSAPPQSDELPGSPLAGDLPSLWNAQSAKLSPFGGDGEPTNLLQISQDRSILSTPEYLRYYYANKNMNPRLPPPVVSARDHIRGVWGDKQTEPFGDSQMLSDADSHAAFNLLLAGQFGSLKEGTNSLPIRDAASMLAQGMSSVNIGSPAQHNSGFVGSPWANATSGLEQLDSLLQACSPKTSHLSSLLSGDLSQSHDNSSGGPHISLYDDLQEGSIFGSGSAPHTPRSAAVGHNLFDAAVGSPQRSGSFTSSPLGKDPKIQLHHAMSSGTPRAAVGDRLFRGTPSKLRIGSLSTDTPGMVADLSGASGQNSVNPLASSAAQQAAALTEALQKFPNLVEQQPGAAAAAAANNPEGLQGILGNQNFPPQMQQAMYMAALYPYYAQQGMQNLAAMQASVYPGFMMNGYSGYPSFPMAPPYGMPGMGDLGSNARPPFPPAPPAAPGMMPPFPAPAEYAAYYQKMMEAQAAMSGSGKDHDGKDNQDDFMHDGRDRRGTSREASTLEARGRARGDRDGPAGGPRRDSGGAAGTRSGRRRDDSADRRMDAVLEEFKANKTRKFEFRDILGHIFEFSLDQYGSRFIQQKLEAISAEEMNAAFNEVLPRSLTLMTDVFGNYVIQKFFEHGTLEQRRRLAEVLKGNVLHLSLQMYGCRVIQKALEVLDTDHQCELIAELDGNVMRCVRDQNGNHVIQKVIECVATERVAHLLDNFMTCVVPLSTHPFGCRVIQRILEHCRDEQRKAVVMEEILKSTCQLAQDQYGNYVIQHVLERGLPTERMQVINQLAPQIVSLSLHKFASNVVEKCLTHCSPVERDVLIRSMLGSGSDALTEDAEDPLQQMMKDQFGNYVVQKVLEVCDDAQREALLGRVRAQLHALKKYTYGKHIVARVEKLLSTGTKIQTHLRNRNLPDDLVTGSGSGNSSPLPHSNPGSFSSASISSSNNSSLAVAAATMAAAAAAAAAAANGSAMTAAAAAKAAMNGATDPEVLRAMLVDSPPDRFGMSSSMHM